MPTAQNILLSHVKLDYSVASSIRGIRIVPVCHPGMTILNFGYKKKSLFYVWWVGMKFRILNWRFTVDAALFPSEFLIGVQQLWNRFGTRLSNSQMISQNPMHGRFSHFQLISYHLNNHSSVSSHKKLHTFDVLVVREVKGRPTLASFSQSSRPSLKRIIHSKKKKKLFSWRHFINFLWCFSEFHQVYDNHSSLCLFINFHFRQRAKNSKTKTEIIFIRNVVFLRGKQHLPSHLNWIIN